MTGGFVACKKRTEEFSLILFLKACDYLRSLSLCFKPFKILRGAFYHAALGTGSSYLRTLLSIPAFGEIPEEKTWKEIIIAFIKFSWSITNIHMPLCQVLKVKYQSHTEQREETSWKNTAFPQTLNVERPLWVHNLIS